MSARMTQEPRQADKGARLDSPLHKAWVSLITTLGTLLTAALAVLVAMIIVVLAVGLTARFTVVGLVDNSQHARNNLGRLGS
jgi:hypothetical protein